MEQPNIAELEHQLIESFADGRLDDDERRTLAATVAQLPSEKQSFLRNKAFAIAREQLSKSPGDSQAVIKTMNWLERVVKTLSTPTSNKKGVERACFSPGNTCLRQILDLCHQAKKSLDICVFTISDDRITEAILKAHRRGVTVRVVTDNDKANDAGSDVDYLQRKGVDLRMDTSPYHMHHKFMVVDGDTLLNGSFNWTRSATDKNEENILVTQSESLVKPFQKQFETLWAQFA
ncbi:phospholipase D-like domain-containing protein [Corallincola platygyrae]|uniref:phospholipase D n=1 Tax=Corallincola platygyrae TaxID=1193278 RepID=A0ABW4XIJ8_9GAMM